MLKEFLRELFSEKCQLTSLTLDISTSRFPIEMHQYLLSSLSNNKRTWKSSITLHSLHIHLDYTYLFECLIEHLPLVQVFSVEFETSLVHDPSFPFKVPQRFRLPTTNCYDKVRRNRNNQKETFAINVNLSFFYSINSFDHPVT